MPRTLLGILCLAAALRVLWFTGLVVGDDVVYSKIALARAEGIADFSNVHECRLGFLLPLTLSYACFGPGEVPLLAYNFLCSLGLVAVAFLLGRRLFGAFAGAAAGGVAAFHPNLVTFATECHTDVAVALLQASSVLCLLSADKSDRPGPRLALGGLLLGWAWLHKEHAVFLGLFVAGHCIATRRRPTWYLPMALAAFAVFTAETLAFALYTGDPFRRFALVRELHAGRYMAERYTSGASIAHRVFLELPLLLFLPRSGQQWMGTINLVGLFGGIGLLAKRVPGAPAVAGWFTAIFASYCAWPSSLSPYLPSFFLFEWTLPVFAVPLAVLAGGALSRRPPLFAGALLALLAGLGLWSSHHAWTEARKFAAGGREALAWIREQRPARVVSDDKTVEVLDFLEGHRPGRRTDDFSKDPAGAVVVVDRFWTEPDRWWTRPSIPPAASWVRLYESRRLTIYRAPP
jgi:hypothetical protein